MPSTEDLAKAARMQEVSAFAELVRCYERPAILTAYSVLGDFHLAQDVAQEAFVVAYRRLGQLRHSASFGPWVMRITYRLALRLLRRRTAKGIGTEQTIGGDDASISPTPVAPPNSNDWLEEYNEVVQQLARLPEHERIVMVMRYVDRRSVGEIAKATGHPAGTVTKRMSRAIQRLRTWLNGEPS
jgi:RNA polymerase sigma-70 factor, ECF subfamily